MARLHMLPLLPLLTALLALLALPAQGLAYTTDVGPNEEFCFREELQKASKIEGGFQVVKGGNYLVDFVVRDMKGRVLSTHTDKSDGTYSFVADATGKYEFCISNKMNVKKTVAFQLSEKTAQSKGLSKNEMSSSIITTVNQIGGAVEDISKKQRFVVEKDARTMHTVKKTADKTATWCLIELITICIIAFAQIIFISRVVQRRKSVGV